MEPTISLSLSSSTLDEDDVFLGDDGTVSIGASVDDPTTTDGTTQRDDNRQCIDSETGTATLTPTVTWDVSGLSAEPSSGSGTGASFTVNSIGSATTTFIAQATTGTPPGDFSASKSAKMNVVKLVTKTVAATPPNTDRKVVGICEEVTCTIEGPYKGTITWAVSGNGTIDNSSGPSTTFTAGLTTDPATVTATITSGTKSISKSVSFTVRKPASALMEYSSTAGSTTNPLFLHVTAKVYVAPDSVNFYNVKFGEGACLADAYGYFEIHGQDKKPHPAHYAWGGSVVVSGKGTLVGTDNIAGGTFGPIYGEGSFKWNIPQVYQGKTESSWTEYDKVLHLKTLEIGSNHKATLRLKKSQVDNPVTEP